MNLQQFKHAHSWKFVSNGPSGDKRYWKCSKCTKMRETLLFKQEEQEEEISPKTEG